MQEDFNPYELLDFLWQRRITLLAVPIIAVAIALCVSLLTPNKYTATATLIIEPPGGSDARVATAVSPVYLESLRTYEQFASSDSLFARACEKFQLINAGGPSIESFKRRVLRVQKLKETKVLQISVTLRDPVKAQALVRFLAEETVALNRSLARDSDREVLDNAGKDATEAEAKVADAEKQWMSSASKGSDTAMQSELEYLSELQYDIERQLVTANASLADYTSREAVMKEKKTGGEDLDYVRQEIAALNSKIAALTKRKATVLAQFQAKSTQAGRWRAQKDRAEEALKIADSTRELALKRKMDLQSGLGMRAEQLRIIDPGIVPQKPSSPDIPLICISAALLGILGAFGFVTFQFGVQRSRPQLARARFR